MKRLLVVLLCLLAVFAVVSCNQEPEASTPDAKPEQHGGTITITPASEDWGTQTGKMQFILINKAADADEAEPFYGQEEISFLLKLSSDVTSFQVRAGKTGGYSTWLKVEDFSTLETDDDGWYIIEIDSTKVNESEGLGFTAYVTAQTQDIEVHIKDLMIDGEVVDFTEWDEATCVVPMLGVPAALSATITK